MHTRQLLLATLVVALGCGGSEGGTSSPVAADAKKLGQDAAKTAKDAGDKMGDELAKAADSLQAYAKTLAEKVSESGSAFAQSVQSKMPAVEQLVDQTKAKLASGGAQAKELALKLYDKLKALKDKLAALTQNAATATKEMKDGVVAAYDDLIAEVRTALKPAAG
jgi:ABC-type transporter Mla subunit MlaD